MTANAIAKRTVPRKSAVAESVLITPFADSLAAHKISSWLIAHGSKVSLRPASEISLHDFRMSPTILIGDFDNPWILTLPSNLRYSANMDPSGTILWIQDQQNPERRDWQLVDQVHGADTFADYALITRFFSIESGQWVVAVQGLGGEGTLAAAELVSQEDLNPLLPANLRNSDKNFQLVVKTVVMGNSISPPQIMATHTW